MNELTKIEKAKKILADADTKNMEEALKEFQEFHEAWGNKYGVQLSTEGDFKGQIFNSKIVIIKK